MTANVCGIGGWSGPLPGDPSNNSILSAVPAFGGVDVTWTYPSTNPYAVAHVLLYRGLSDNFDAAIQIAVVAGSFYYDRVLPQIVPYRYWIRIVSINGTIGDLIGPALATPRLLIEDVISKLSGRISNSELAQALRSDIDKIALNYAELVDEIADRISGDEQLTAAFAEVQSGVTQSIALINEETTTRQSDYSALASQINTVAAATGNAAALVTAEQIARVNGDEALAEDIALLQTAQDDLGAAVLDLNQAKIGYAVLAGTSTAYDGDGTTIVYPAATYPTATYPEYSVNRTRIIDKVGVARWNLTSAGIAKPLEWLVGLPLATAVKGVQVMGPDGTGASIESAMSAQKTLNDGFKAQYTVKISTVNNNGDKVVGGYGLYGDATGVSAGFDVDTFWLGRPNLQSKRYPFIYDSTTSQIYMDDAVIRSLTFKKLRDEAGSFIVEDNKIKGQYLKVDQLAVGAFTGWDWPAAGAGGGVFINTTGVLMGNARDESYFYYEKGQANSSTNTKGIFQFGSNGRNLTINGTGISTNMTLSGCDGTFSGTLTANAVNAVSTVNIAGNSVTWAVYGEALDTDTFGVGAINGYGYGEWKGAKTEAFYFPYSGEAIITVSLVTDYVGTSQAALQAIVINIYRRYEGNAATDYLVKTFTVSAPPSAPIYQNMSVVCKAPFAGGNTEFLVGLKTTSDPAKVKFISVAAIARSR